MSKNKTSVLIRVDSGPGIGFGHFVRCLSLSEELTKRGAEVTIAMRTPTAMDIARIESVNARPHLIHDAQSTASHPTNIFSRELQRRDAQKSLGNETKKWDAIIVDHYNLDKEWETVARSRTRKLVVIDDLANRQHYADVLVDHNWYGPDTGSRYESLINSDALQLLGPRYCLLNPVYARTRERQLARSVPPKTMLINFGGTDAAAQTLNAVKAALHSTQLDIEVALGSPSSLNDDLLALVRSESRLTLHVALPHLAEVLARVDLVVGASGTGTWERICMGVPSIVTTVNKGQSGVTKALSERGLCIWLGIASEVTVRDYSKAFEEFLAKMPPKPPAIVDGYGSSRVALNILDASLENMNTRKASKSDDASFVSGIAQADPNSGPEDWYKSQSEFLTSLASDADIRILHIEGVPIGTEFSSKRLGAQRFTDKCLQGGSRRCHK